LRRRLRGVALTLVAMAVAAGCSRAPAAGPAPAWQAADVTPAAAPTGNAAPAEGGPVDVPTEGGPVDVPAALRFTGTTIDGKPFDAGTLAGRPALLWFWAPWCATCASEAQSIGDLAEKYRGRLGILGVAGMGGNRDMHEFVSDFSLQAVPHLDDQAGRIWKRFKIKEQSLYVVLDRAGTVVKTGYLDDLQLTAEVESLLL
jgi:thiol-disulfide isomerase/thioredoxin